ncbi:MAG: nuclear transport factor 2 family protein [Burkholderiales bacterium]|nr:nuclear transport factor 2 family protein [Bacteroidia bacterium]
MERKKIIKDYINAYNNFDIEKMLKHLDEQLKFENISEGVTNMTMTDLHSFRKQAEQATKLFTTRKQTIKSWTHQDNLIEIEIEYNAVLAIDFNGLKKGDNINLEGKSIFKFSGHKIIELIDIS